MTEDSQHNEQAKPSEAKARTAANQGNEEDGAPPAQTTPWAFYVVIIAFLCITLVYLVVWLYPTPKYSPEAARS
jgi:ABC-type Na+ efflux pump permease subunit